MLTISRETLDRVVHFGAILPNLLIRLSLLVVTVELSFSEGLFELIKAANAAFINSNGTGEV
jgi:hypothetical protein